MFPDGWLALNCWFCRSQCGPVAKVSNIGSYNFLTNLNAKIMSSSGADKQIRAVWKDCCSVWDKTVTRDENSEERLLFSMGQNCHKRWEQRGETVVQYGTKLSQKMRTVRRDCCSVLDKTVTGDENSEERLLFSMGQKLLQEMRTVRRYCCSVWDKNCHKSYLEIHAYLSRCENSVFFFQNCLKYKTIFPEL